jgi:hypothetical protein
MDVTRGIRPRRKKVKCVFSFTYPIYRDSLEQQCNKRMYSDRTRNFLLNRNIFPVESVVEEGRSAACTLYVLFRVGLSGY